MGIIVQGTDCFLVEVSESRPNSSFISLHSPMLMSNLIDARHSLYLAIVYGTLYMLFAAFPIVFQQERGWSPGISGLAFLGVLAGFACALLWTVFIENPRYDKKLEAEGGWLPPEQRLVSALIGGCLLP